MCMLAVVELDGKKHSVYIGGVKPPPNDIVASFAHGTESDESCHRFNGGLYSTAIYLVSQNVRRTLFGLSRTFVERRLVSQNVRRTWNE
eukprot:1338303-Amorphochlora_amoeboformis.AAC.1